MATNLGIMHSSDWEGGRCCYGLEISGWERVLDWRVGCAWVGRYLNVLLDARGGCVCV